MVFMGRAPRRATSTERKKSMCKRVCFPLFALLVACGAPDFISTFEGQMRFQYDCGKAQGESFGDGQSVTISETKDGVAVAFAGSLMADEGMCPELSGTTTEYRLTVKPAECAPYEMAGGVQRLAIDGGTMALADDMLTLDLKGTRYVNEGEDWGYTCAIVIVGSLVRRVAD